MSVNVIWLRDDDNYIPGTSGYQIQEIHGGGGDDRLHGGYGNDSLYGDAGNDSLYGDSGNDLVTGQDGNDSLVGHSGNDTLSGDAGNDYLLGSQDNDTLHGGDGNDVLEGGQDDDTLWGDAGNDTLWGADRYFKDEQGKDLLYGGDGNDELHGAGKTEPHLDGNDTLYGGYGDDSLYGDGGNDVVSGEWGDDLVTGQEGDDTLWGGDGFDTLSGDAGNDFLYSGRDDDYLYGGDGNDSLDGGHGNDQLWGDTGQDSAFYLTAPGGIRIDSLSWGAVISDGYGYQDTLYGIDNIYGSFHNDVIIGDNEWNNELWGGIGDDILDGQGGDDTLIGGIGGLDYLNGGDGFDIAVYGGKESDYKITAGENNTWQVVNMSWRNANVDVLRSIEQISFEDDNMQLWSDLRKNTVSAVAAVHDGGTNTSHSISGGDAKATNFVIGIKGSPGIELDLNTRKLASFINDIIPTSGDDITDFGFSLLDAAIPGIPILQTLANVLVFDPQEVKERKENIDKAINDYRYDSNTWATITQQKRDQVVVEDFKIGVDSLFLPSGSPRGYTVTSGEEKGKNGVWIGAKEENGSTSNFLFITNNYANKTNTQFFTEINNLLSDSIIGTFVNKRIDTNGNDGKEVGTYAGDWIYGLAPGSFQLVGEFGNDLLQGNNGNDKLFGGFEGEIPDIGTKLTYEDDGSDILQGGKGNDTLNGGTGNDILYGGGLTYDSNGNIIGVITNDGADTLEGGFGNDIFVFNTLSTGIDKIKDFKVLVDKIHIDKSDFGATDNSQFSFNQSNGALSFNSQQFATLENFADLQGFDVSRDIVLV